MAPFRRAAPESKFIHSRQKKKIDFIFKSWVLLHMHQISNGKWRAQMADCRLDL